MVTYFGEDLQGSSSNYTNTFPHPNADAAKNNFTNQLNTVITQNFESIPVGTASPISVNFGSTTATITGTGATVSNVQNSGAFATSGTHYLFSTTDTSLAFSTPEAAFGFYGTDIGDSGATSLILTLNNSIQEQVPIPANFTSAANGSVLYFGLIAPSGEEFTGITFPNNSKGADYFGFDDFTIATPKQVNLPEPGLASACFIGAALLLLVRRQKPQTI